MLEDALDLASRLLPLRSVRLYLDDPVRRADKEAPLTLVATAFGDAAEVGSEQGRTRGLVATAYGRGKTAQRRVLKPSPHAEIAIPVRLESAVCGVLVAERKGTATFSAKERDLIELIARYVSRAILNAIDILKQNKLALTDELTGLPSVRGLDGALHKAITDAKKTRGDVAVFFVDVDRLKRINDVLGHRAGSEALRRVANAMSRTLGMRGETFRFGGDEFVVIVPALSETDAREVANEIREAVRAATAGPYEEGGALPAITVSVGVASLRATLGARGDSKSLATRLVGAADRALYKAKERRDATVLATPQDDPKKGQPES